VSVAVLPQVVAAGASTIPLADLDEPSLVQRAVARDSDAFGEIYHRYSGDVHRILSRLLRDYPADVDDVASQVFVTALEQIPSYQDRGRPFSAWLRTLIRYRALEHRNWRRSRREDELPAPGSASAELMARRGMNPEDEAILRLELRRLLRSLTARRRLALALRDWAGWSYEEIAHALNTSHRNADAVIVQARKAVCKAALGQQALRERYPSRPTRPAAQGSAQDRVLAEIEASGSPGITRNVLRKRAGLPAAQLAGIVDLLTQQRLISVAQEPTLPRPTTRYQPLTRIAAGRVA
jgi:RNA polymerase sigma-70 factor (ECF subfamily)